MNPRNALLALALALVLAGLPLVAAQDVSFTAHATESGCSGTNYCFDIEGGPSSSIAAGSTVEVTVVNGENNSADHSFYFDWTGDHDPANEDSAEVAGDAETDALASGEQETVTFTIPEDAADTLYLWCDEPGHESLGMHTSWTITGTDGGGGNGNGGNGNGPSTPGFGLMAALAAAGVAAALVARRRE